LISAKPVSGPITGVIGDLTPTIRRSRRRSLAIYATSGMLNHFQPRRPMIRESCELKNAHLTQHVRSCCHFCDLCLASPRSNHLFQLPLPARRDACTHPAIKPQTVPALFLRYQRWQRKTLLCDSGPGCGARGVKDGQRTEGGLRNPFGMKHHCNPDVVRDSSSNPTLSPKPKTHFGKRTGHPRSRSSLKISLPDRRDRTSSFN